MIDKYLKVKEVAEIINASQMTVIRLCRDGKLPFVQVGTMRRIKQIDLDYYLLNPNRKPKAPESERPVYAGLPPEQCGFAYEEDEWSMSTLCAKAQPILDAKKASAVKVPEPVRQPDKPYVGPYKSGFYKNTGLEALLSVYDDEE
jgi:excisionase family DNA binding protein